MTDNNSAATELEPVWVSTAKDHVLAQLEQSISETNDDGVGVILETDFIDVADTIIETLIAAGVTIPETIRRPDGFFNTEL